MTDRISHFTVILTEDLREDCVEDIVNALSMVRGVASVIPGVVTDADHVARELVRWEYRSAVLQGVSAAFDHARE